MRIDPDLFLDSPVRWWELANHPRAALTDAWRVTHHASQAAAEIGKVFALPCDDDSHTTLQWFDGASITDGFLTGQLVEAEDGPFSAALRLYDMVLFLIRPSGEPIADLPLPGSTVEHATKWIVDAALNSTQIEIRQESNPAPDLPGHPVGEGAEIPVPNQLAQIELVRLYSNTNTMLSALHAEHDSASEARCWPHHFDLASLTELAHEGDVATRTIGIGVTPPDPVSESGYWYVSPWAAGDLGKKDPPRLKHGRWHDRAEGSPPMAVLDISDLGEIEEEDLQKRIVAQFIAGAFNASAEILDV